MFHFDSDYMEGAHPLILERLAEINFEKIGGYGNDDYCTSAAERIRKACGAPEADIRFLVGGTQTNATIIRSILRPYEGVVAADTGHIAVHESGAIEATGHKVLTIENIDGKLTAERLDAYLVRERSDENRDHAVWSGMVYISQPTELGTIYSRAELEALSEVCHRWGLPLFADGARLGYALAAPTADFTLEDMARLCDIFYIGGTKVGALMGEAVVVPRGEQIAHFTTLIKQQGALLAKGWLLGVQFDTLFTDNLYLDIARNAVYQAERMSSALVERGYELASPTLSNQIFLRLSPKQLEHLSTIATFSTWERQTDCTIVRLATSWATTDKQIDDLINAL
ncbi:MAG: low specificity L-threonine aldolase [Rikenellaceae bacterium]|nr:low specificity L-threonine aldolase [Rikenellaceae bacterium]